MTSCLLKNFWFRCRYIFCRRWKIRSLGGILKQKNWRIVSNYVNYDSKEPSNSQMGSLISWNVGMISRRQLTVWKNMEHHLNGLRLKFISN